MIYRVKFSYEYNVSNLEHSQCRLAFFPFNRRINKKGKALTGENVYHIQSYEHLLTHFL